MTREENILTLNEHLDHWKRLLSEKICDQDEGEKTIDALQNAIKALEQQPSSTENPKVGHWEWNQYDANPKIGNFHCSLCHSIGRSYFDYCPYCGVKMSEIPTGEEGSEE